MVHPVVDIQKWIARYPLDAHLAALDAGSAPDFRYREPDDIFSPRQLALTEQMRTRAGLGSSRGVPVDVLLPALGEPPRREVSKISGLPYRPREPWPVDGAGVPMQFLGQLCLADSMEVLPAGGRAMLPGGVLLIFVGADGDFIYNETSGSPLHFEWRRLGIPEADLMGAADLPERSGHGTPTYFERHRTMEYPGTDGRAGVLRWKDRVIEASGVFRSSKIGGVPAWQQGEEEAAGLGEYFASLHSINPSEDEYPFPNVPKSAWGRYPHTQGFLMLGDVGTLYLFAKGGGRVGWLMQCG